jgi:hypothetical protein
VQTEDALVKQIRTALLRVDSSNSRDRLTIYQFAIRALDNVLANSASSEAQKLSVKNKMALAIQQIENEYTAARHVETDLVSNADIRPAQISPEPVLDAVVQQVQNVEFDVDEKGFIGKLMEDFKRNVSFKSARYGVVVVILLAGLVLVGNYFWSVYAGLYGGKYDQVTQDIVTPVTPSNEGQSGSNESDRIYFLDFTKSEDAIELVRATHKDRISIDDQSKIMTAKGEVEIYGKSYFAVNPSQIHLMRFELRLPKGASRLGQKLLAGFATYDKDKKLQTSRPGTHRYFVSSGAIRPDLVADTDGWISLSGLITDTGDRVDAFREGSEFARVFFILNQGADENQIEIRNVEVYAFD